MQSLPDLHRRLAYASRLHADSRAVQDAAPVLRALRVKAVAKLRTFFWQRFDALRKPKTNIQIKQTVLVKHRRAFEFLLRNAGDVALELKQIYITIMSQVWDSTSLENLDVFVLPWHGFDWSICL